jgi:hypothetical protein
MFAGSSGAVSCPSNATVDHAVLLIGYNSSHWFIKNSWATTWGDNGFGYISKANDCNLHSWIDVMQIDFPFSPSPAPTPTPIPTPTDKITLTI